MDASPAPERMVVGRIVRPHGLRGEVSVEVLSDAPDRFSPGRRMAAGADADSADRRELSIRTARRAQGKLLVGFDGLDDRDAVEDLRGLLLTIPLGEARPLGEDEFWSHQLTGLEVVDAHGTVRGTVTEVQPGTAHDLLVVALGGGGTVLVPAVAALVTVDLAAGRVTVADVGGLLDPS